MLLTYSIERGLNEHQSSASVPSASSYSEAVSPHEKCKATCSSTSDVAGSSSSRGYEYMLGCKYSGGPRSTEAVLGRLSTSKASTPITSPFDCWADMIPRQLEEGLPEAQQHHHQHEGKGHGEESARRQRREERVLYPSELAKKQMSNRPAPAPATPRRPRFVRFAQVNDVHSVLSRSSYTPEESSSTWYDKRDLFQMKFDAGMVVQQMRSGHRFDEFCDDSIVTTRGLERHWSEEHAACRRERKASVVRAVLEEQDHQRRCGVTYPQNVRLASMSISWQSRDMSQSAGDWDEYVAWYGAWEVPRTVVSLYYYEGGGEEGGAARSGSPKPTEEEEDGMCHGCSNNEWLASDTFSNDENAPPAGYSPRSTVTSSSFHLGQPLSETNWGR